MSLKDHLEFIKEKGNFQIDCSTSIFSIEQIKLLHKYGHWFNALIDGSLKPITKEQEYFIQVFKNNEAPVTPEQCAWFKYVKRKELELKQPEKFNLNYQVDNEDPFFRRKDWEKMRNWNNR